MEVWKGVIYQGKDYSDFYEVSSLARFRNAKTKRIVKQHVNHEGYLIYVGSLGKRGLQKAFKIHKCVAETFIDNPCNHKEVNHIDGNKTNNSIANLEWCTHEENSRHCVDVLGKLKGENNVASKAVLAKDKSGNIVYTFESINQASEYIAKQKNQHRGWVSRSIMRVMKGMRKTYDGLIWEYRDIA